MKCYKKYFLLTYKRYIIYSFVQSVSSFTLLQTLFKKKKVSGSLFSWPLTDENFVSPETKLDSWMSCGRFSDK